MTHSLSTFDADRPPAMYRSATLAIVVSNTSMKVGTTTAAATNQGLITGRLRSLGASVTLLTVGSFGTGQDEKEFARPTLFQPSTAALASGKWGRCFRGFPVIRHCW